MSIELANAGSNHFEGGCVAAAAGNGRKHFFQMSPGVIVGGVHDYGWEWILRSGFEIDAGMGIAGLRNHQDAISATSAITLGNWHFRCFGILRGKSNPHHPDQPKSARTAALQHHSDGA